LSVTTQSETCRCIAIIDKSLEVFYREDPNTEISSKVKRDVISISEVLFENTERKMTASQTVAYPGIFFGRVQQLQLTEDRENGDLGVVAP
jgi:hypothetical protein